MTQPAVSRGPESRESREPERRLVACAIAAAAPDADAVTRPPQRPQLGSPASAAPQEPAELAAWQDVWRSSKLLFCGFATSSEGWPGGVREKFGTAQR